MKKGEHKGKRAGGDRGLYDFAAIRDTKGATVTVRTSSAACESCVWVFCTGLDGEDASPHLNAKQARRLADALTRFADAAEVP